MCYWCFSHAGVIVSPSESQLQQEITTNTEVKLVAFEDADRAAEGRKFDFRKAVAYGADKAFGVL